MEVELHNGPAPMWWTAEGWRRRGSPGMLWKAFAFGFMAVTMSLTMAPWPMGVGFGLFALREVGGCILKSGRVRGDSLQRGLAVAVHVLTVLALCVLVVVIVHGARSLLD